MFEVKLDDYIVIAHKSAKAEYCRYDRVLLNNNLFFSTYIY